jgi:hypothetical protein
VFHPVLLRLISWLTHAVLAFTRGSLVQLHIAAYQPGCTKLLWVDLTLPRAQRAPRSSTAPTGKDVQWAVLRYLNDRKAYKMLSATTSEHLYQGVEQIECNVGCLTRYNIAMLAGG